MSNNASACKFTNKKRTPVFRGSSFIAAVCFLILSFLAIDASGNPQEAARPALSSQTGSKPAAAQTQSAASSKKKTKQPAPPIVSETTKSKAENIASEISPALPENLETQISKFFGLRYKKGGQGTDGIDCSGLVQKVYSDVFGIDLPRSSWQQSRLNSLENVTEDELQAGDLLFFGPRRKQVNHVGMYLAGGYFLHAARSEGVTISRIDNGYWKSRWIFSKRVKGLGTDYDSDKEHELDGTLEPFAGAFGFAWDDSSDAASFLEGGIKINDSLEFLLSGFILSSLDDHAPRSDFQPTASLQTTAAAETRSGFRLASIHSPSEWFKLIPSLTQIESAKNEKSGGANRQTFGLETRMTLPSSRIDVFLGAQAKNKKDLLGRPLDVAPDWQTLGMALGLHYRLTDFLRFSLWGTHARNSDLKENEDPAQGKLPLDNVSFRFDLKF